jgi:hypothetical protein
MTLESNSSRFGKRVVIVVPALAHRQKPIAIQIGSLNARTQNLPRAGPRVVRQVSDDPVTCNADGDAQAHSPANPAPSADQEEHKSQRQLLQHPSSFKPLIEDVRLDFLFDLKRRRALKIGNSVARRRQAR